MRKERWFQDGDKIIRHKQTDPTAALQSAEDLRSNDMTTMFGQKDSWHVGRIDMHVLEMWIKEAGLTWDQTHEVGELVKRKLLDGDFAKFRVHGGTF